MIEPPTIREAREKAEAASREANIRRYEEKMGVQLPYSPVNAVVRQPKRFLNGTDMTDTLGTVEEVLHNQPMAEARNQKKELPVLRNQPKRNRADYMKKYRAKERKCPHCGGKL